MTLLFLRTGERVTYEATDRHREQVQAVVDELAQRLLEEDEWESRCGKQCAQCSYARYCSAVTQQPEAAVQKERKLQLCLSV